MFESPAELLPAAAGDVRPAKVARATHADIDRDDYQLAADLIQPSVTATTAAVAMPPAPECRCVHYIATAFMPIEILDGVKFSCHYSAWV